MFGETGMIIGQILSFVAVATGFTSFQMKTTGGILFFQILTGLLFSAHYLLIGAPTAAALNLLATVMGMCYYIRNKRESKSLFIPILFTVLIFITSLLTWDGWYSIFLLLGLAINAVNLSLSNPQTIRKLVLIKSPLCLIYNACVFSTGGIIYEVATLTSAIIGILKNRTKKQKSDQTTDL
ncbi:MAG: YgjV family protein [Clostridia bacterium]|nr:YgjV family protein [Clostridia bacterium]